MKYCSKGDHFALKSTFNKSTKARDGLHWWCKECLKQYRIENASRIAAANKNPSYADTRKKCRDSWRSRNPHKVKAQSRSDYVRRKPARRIRDRQRYVEDVQFKLRKLLRERLRKAAKHGRAGSAVALLGCSIDELKVHLESQFVDGMSWSNWSRDGWHIDHVKPLSSFDLTNMTQLKEAMNYSNLAPLWAPDNLAKGSSIE
jgi:hypothetical protein